MEANVREYEIPPPQISLSWKRKMALFLGVGCFMFGFRWVIEGFLHWRHQSMIEALIMPLVLGAWFSWRFPQRLFAGGSVIIGDDFVEGRTRAQWFMFKKRIRRERIKSISENKRGLCVMDRGEFAARMLGFVFIPSIMPEYQEIKSILVQWAPLKAQTL